MKPRHTNASGSPVRRVLITITTLVLLAAGGIGVYGLWFAPTQPTQSATPPSVSATPPAPAPSTGRAADSEAFARQVAAVLFNWDTHTTTPAEIMERLLGWADPTGTETNGLAADLGNYLPDAAIWDRLREYDTIQRLTIDTIGVPEQWRDAVSHAESGQILPGTTAWTITGTRHREGVIDGQLSSVERPVAFTVFITCAPSFPQCHVMRLSQLDNPLK